MQKPNYNPQEIYQLHRNMEADFTLEPGTRIYFDPFHDGSLAEFEAFLYENSIKCLREPDNANKKDVLTWFMVEYP